uniref:NADH-ubiquinone oxidoreductase chain 5 n=1 Tax=Pupa strigosa TaxID=96460 RepID=Q9T9G6_9GAST|nr:NADH dehydrogenase subunit 5 [Pupa strigosa]BAA89017.1 ND5 [Pupa strigosa]
MLFMTWALSLSGMFMLLTLYDKTTVFEFELVQVSTSSFNLVFVLDKVSVSFSIVVTLISSSVFLFGQKYMEEDPFSTRFFWILLAFVISMNLLIFAGSVLFLLLGWDGLGISSFALIIYYQSKESLSAGFQTLLVNRLGDCLIVLTVFLFVLNGQFSYISMSDTMLSGSLLTLIALAAMTKSAQYPFSSWLPAAMAAPTPVSALVHSSTLVTAGIYLLIRFSLNIPLNNSVTALLLWTGSITCLLGGWAATYENDVKKIIALSTLSQLGVMVFSLGLNLPQLSLFHLYTHAMFSALLFLAAGHILLTSFGSQDLRMLGGIGMTMPYTCIMFNISSLCLVAAPFLSAFYSKHLILEMMMCSWASMLNILLMGVATLMTAKYVARMMMAVSWKDTVAPLLSSSCSVYTWMPVLLLGGGGIVSGKFLSSLDTSLFEGVVLPPMINNTLNLVTIIGLFLGIFLSSKVKNPSLSSLFYLSPLLIGSPWALSTPLKFLRYLDYGWLEPKFLVSNPSYFGALITTSEVGLPNE